MQQPVDLLSPPAPHPAPERVVQRGHPVRMLVLADLLALVGMAALMAQRSPVALAYAAGSFLVLALLG